MELFDRLMAMLPFQSNRTIFWIVTIAAIFTLMARIGRRLKPGHHPDYSRTNRQANLLALAYLILDESDSHWNDPTASDNTAASNARLREQWGLHSGQDVFDTVVRLLTVRHHREPWQRLLAARAVAAQAEGGRRPATEQWLAAVRDSSGSAGGEELKFIKVIEYYEKELGRERFPRNDPVLSLDGFALAQAVAVATWGVGLGLISNAESMQLIEQANEVARREFGSWEAFGRSFLLGEVMELTGGNVSKEGLAAAKRRSMRLNFALDDEYGGPWDRLPWQLQEG